MTMPSFLRRIDFRVPKDHHDAFEDLLEPWCLALTSFEDQKTGDWKIEGYTAAEPDSQGISAKLNLLAKARQIAMPKVYFDLVPPKNWLAENLMDFPPLRVGRYYIHGTHIQNKPVGGLIELVLDSGSAFGSGEHATTEGCLRVMEALARRYRFNRILDMGCGSGILAMAAAKTWARPVIASDIDDEATRVTIENARQNGLKKLIRATAGDGYASNLVRHNGPYDLIVCNILANPLVSMAGDLYRNLRRNPKRRQFAILSGLLERDANRVIAAHRARGLRLYRKLVINGWVILVMFR
ncbi:MAG: 50S ribosomal protein L11 methyltransferase [Rhodospirillales bacterium]|nr:50S ribosomal protein L11 methyltransferase [Rhodospirillales bacterium]